MASSKADKIRVRIAPSPTGLLHFGTARTALFNWLFARHNGGSFIVRIEDTDLERSDRKYEKDILDGLSWLGLDWDEGPDRGGEYGPYRQSERLDIYEKYLKRLLDEQKAYYCYCTKEELEIERQAMLSQGLPPKYSGRCRAGASGGREPQVIRFKMPDAVVEFKDLIRDKIKFNMELIGDMAIAKNTRAPLYNFAVVIDDSEMKISHVIRGEDHIANTPKQLVLQRALDFETPEYAHLPLILSQDRSKLSKRYVETSIIEYSEAGYLPDAMVNFMALMGWHPKNDREVLSREELVNEFDLDRVQKAGAIFNEEKLNWLNAQHLRQIPIDKLAENLAPLLEKAGIKSEKQLLRRALKFEKDRMKTFQDFVKNADFYFVLPEYGAQLLIWKNESKETIKANLEKIQKKLAALAAGNFTSDFLETELNPVAEMLGRGAVLWPLRAALSGKEASPGPFEIMEALGKEETMRRIKAAIEKL